MFFFKQKAAYEMRISDWSSDVCSSDLKVVRPLCEQLDDYQIVQNRDLPDVFWETCKKKGLFSLMIPKEYGGKGFSAHMHSQLVQLMGSRSGNASATVTVPNSLGQIGRASCRERVCQYV